MAMAILVSNIRCFDLRVTYRADANYCAVCDRKLIELAFLKLYWRDLYSLALFAEFPGLVIWSIR